MGGQFICNNDIPMLYFSTKHSHVTRNDNTVRTAEIDSDGNSFKP